MRHTCRTSVAASTAYCWPSVLAEACGSLEIGSSHSRRRDNRHWGCVGPDIARQRTPARRPHSRRRTAAQSVGAIVDTHDDSGPRCRNARRTELRVGGRRIDRGAHDAAAARRCPRIESQVRDPRTPCRWRLAQTAPAHGGKRGIPDGVHRPDGRFSTGSGDAAIRASAVARDNHRRRSAPSSAYCRRRRRRDPARCPGPAPVDSGGSNAASPPATHSITGARDLRAAGGCVFRAPGPVSTRGARGCDAHARRSGSWRPGARIPTRDCSYTSATRSPTG